MTTTRIVEKLSSLVQSQLPEFVQSDYNTFVSFLQAYYEFLEQDQNAQEVLQNARSYSDIDRTIDSFVEYFIVNYCQDLPRNIVSDKKHTIKNITDLYKNKGTEKAYELLFRILFNEKINFFYPYTVVLKSSDGKWSQDVSLRVYDTGDDPFNLVGTKVTGNISGASAIVERVLNFQNGDDSVYELFLNRLSINGTFAVDEPIIGTKLDNAISGSSTTTTSQSFGVLSSVTINNGGVGFEVDDTLTINGGDGTGATAKVGSVSDTGAIRKIIITDFGSGYTTAPNVTIAASTVTKTGIYNVHSNVATLFFSTPHGLEANDTVAVNFTTGTATDGTYTVLYAPNQKNIKFALSNANTTGNVTISYSKAPNLTAVVGAICNYEGRWIGNDGKLDENIVLEGRTSTASDTDPVFYQPYSYVIRTSQAIERWRDVVKDVLHPAGFALFGEINVDTPISDVPSLQVTNVSTTVTSLLSYIINIILAETGNVQIQSTDQLVIKYIDNIYPSYLYSKVGAGPRYGTLETWKFSWGPSTINNEDHSFYVKDVAGVVIGDVVNTPNKKYIVPPPSKVATETTP